MMGVSVTGLMERVDIVVEVNLRWPEGEACGCVILMAKAQTCVGLMMKIEYFIKLSHNRCTSPFSFSAVKVKVTKDRPTSGDHCRRSTSSRRITAKANV